MKSCTLQAAGWNKETRRALQQLIAEGSGRQLPAVFDFDNTLVCGDIGEATLAIFARNKVLTPQHAPTSLCPAFRTGTNRLVRMSSCADVTEYYEALLEPTVHGAKDPQPLANGYAWATQVMEGLQLTQVIKATRAAVAWSDRESTGRIEVTPGRTAYPVPSFYAEMVELIGELLKHRFDVWIVSASNVWSVRCMVLEKLNPLLRSLGYPAGLRAEHIVGVSTLLMDRSKHLYKDPVLVHENKGYASLHPGALRRFRLTGQMQYPVPTYSGKIAAIFSALGRNPFLVAGDSPGDLPMMAIGRHRLWIARQGKPAYQRAARQW